MKTAIFAALLASVSTLAAAADLPLKAPIVQPPLFGFASDGWYVGIETGAAVQNTSGGLFVNALANSKLTAAGGTVGGCAGYVRGHAGSWWGIHACGDWQNITAGTTVAGVPNTASRWSATQEVRIGGNPLSWIVNALPNLGLEGFSFPTFTPPSVSGGVNIAAAPHSYLGAGVSEFGIRGSIGGATGTTIGVAPMLKAGAIWQALDSTGKPNGGAIDTYAEVVFAKRGITINNAFAANGGPVLGGSANMGTLYKAGLAYYFALPR